MDEQPVKFYRYRYLNCWEAELPVGWTGKNTRLALSFLDGKGVEVDFTVSTLIKSQWESLLKLQNEEARIGWEKLINCVLTLDDSLSERKPQVEREMRNPKDDCLRRYQAWAFKGKDFLISVHYSYKSEERDPMQVATVKHFVNTLRLVED